LTNCQGSSTGGKLGEEEVVWGGGEAGRFDSKGDVNILRRGRVGKKPKGPRNECKTNASMSRRSPIGKKGKRVSREKKGDRPLQAHATPV